MRKRYIPESGVSRVNRLWTHDIPERQTRTRRTGLPIVNLAGITEEEYDDTLIVSERGQATGGPIAGNRYRR